MICTLCPRRCGAVRTETGGGGICAMPAGLRLARAGLHLWEEPCISGTNGSGAVFFSGCNLRCVFCQNGKISAGGFGKAISVSRLREIFDALIARGAHNINLVSPTQFTPWILQALDEPLPVPVVWNSGGYETVETLQTLAGKVQIYLPDLKYALPEPAERFSHAADYFDFAAPAILEMFRQTGPYVREDGLLRSGVVIRHLMLPGQAENTRRVIDWVAEQFRPGDVLFSLMSQYTPQENATPPLNRHVTRGEYAAACAYLENCGIEDGFFQERTSARREFTPDFDLSGL
ncbi:MAG: radical SAM protein [Oscillospiraceae bacterium]